MKKVILQYLASALTVILILGLVVSNRQRNQSLVKKVKDPEISLYLSGLFGKSRQTGPYSCWGYPILSTRDLSVRKEDGKIRLVLHVIIHMMCR